MVSSRMQVSARYAETNQMGFVSEASFIPWLESGRSALLKEHGFDYRQLETLGYLLPVLEVGLTFLHPVFYDDSVIIETTLRSRPTFRIRLEYGIWRDDVLLARGHSVQAFVNRDYRPVRPPADFMAKLELLFPRESAQPAARATATSA